MLKPMLLALVALVLTACSLGQLSEDGQKVQLVDAVSLGDLMYYDYIAPLAVYGEYSEEAARNEIRNQAARVRIYFVKVGPVTADYCKTDILMQMPKTCFSIKGEGYNLKPKD